MCVESSNTFAGGKKRVAYRSGAWHWTMGGRVRKGAYGCKGDGKRRGIQMAKSMIKPVKK